MKGHIKERSPGHWAIILDARDAAGKRKRKWHSFKGTKRQAQTECSRLITEMESGDYVEPSKVTLAVFFERRLRHIKPNVSPKRRERLPCLRSLSRSCATGAWRRPRNC